MPRPRLQKQLVPIPLTSGLSQREDPAHLQPGQAIQITNFVKDKQSTLGKAPGYKGLGVTPIAGANVSYVAAVAAHQSVPIVIATDTAFGPAAYSYSDNDNNLTLIDRVPEVFIPTPQMVFAFQQPMQDYDCAVLAPAGVPTIVLHVCTVDINSTGNYRVYYAITDYTTKSVIVSAQEVSVLAGTAGAFVSPKLTTCVSSGTTTQCVLTVGLTGGNNLYAAQINMSTLAWSGGSALVTNIFNPAAYDICSVDDDSTSLVLVYEKSSARNIVVASFNSGTLASVATGTFADTTWSGAAGNPHITGFAIRASVASTAAWLAYGWQTGSTTITAFVHGGAIVYPSLAAAFATPVDLTNGMTNTYPAPRLLDIKEVSQALGVQQVVWSPPNVKVGYDPTYIATPVASHPPPLCAIYQSAFFQSSGAAVLEANQPRWTNGVLLASRMYPYQLAQGLGNVVANNASQAFVVGFMPSQNLNPTWSGVNAVSTPTTSAVANVPYAPYVTFFGGHSYAPNASGGAQAVAALNQTSNATQYTSNATGQQPVGASVTNVAVTEPGSGYTAAPTAQLNWGYGSVLFADTKSATKGTIQDIGVVIGVGPQTATANITVSGGTVNVVTVASGFAQTLIDSTLVISGSTHAANNNGQFLIVNCNAGYSNVVTIANPNAIAETGVNVSYTPSGQNYNTQPGTVPIYVQDIPNNVIYTDVGTAIVATSGSLQGQIVGANLSAAAANITVWQSTANTFVFTPVPNVPGITFTGANTSQAVSVGCFAQVATTLIQSAGYENIQGSFFLFSMDTFSDFTTPNDTSTPYRNTPMRLVAALKPRLGLNTIVSNAHTLPHISQSSRTGVPPWGPPVFDLPINVSPTSVGIMQFQPEMFPTWAITSPMYQGDELGGLTALSAGEPTLTDGARIMGFAEPYYPENLYVYPLGPNAPGGSGLLFPGSSYEYIATFERMDRPGNVHRSGRSVPVTLVTLPTYDDSRYESQVVIPTMGFSPAQHGTNQQNLANVAPQPPILIQLYRTSSPGSTTGGPATTGGTEFFNLSPTSQGVAQNDLWSPYVVITDGSAATASDSAISTHPKLYGDGSDGVEPGSNLDTLCPPALQGIIVHKNRFWGFEGSNVWYTKAFTSGEGPGFNEQMAFSVDDGSGDITALASMDERLLVFKRDRIFYVVGDGPNDNLSSNDLQPPQRIQSDVGAVSQAGIIIAPSGVFFLSDDGLYQVTRKFEVAHYGSFVDDWIAQYPIITSGCLDLVNGRLVWTASKPNTGSVTPGSIVILYSYLWDAWTVERLDEGSGNYVNFQVTSAKLTGTPPVLTVGGNYANTGGPFVMRERTDGVYLTPNSAGTATYQQSVWQSPWMKAQDFQGFARWSLITLSLYNSDINQIQVILEYNYSSTLSQTFTISAAAMAAAQKSGTPYPIVQWELQPNFAKAESMRATIIDKADATQVTSVGKGSILLACTITMALKDGAKTYPLPVSQRGSA